MVAAMWPFVYTVFVHNQFNASPACTGLGGRYSFSVCPDVSVL